MRVHGQGIAAQLVRSGGQLFWSMGTDYALELLGLLQCLGFGGRFQSYKPPGGP